MAARIGRTPAPDLGVDPDLILDPANRKFFGREPGNEFTSYGLLLYILCKIFYRDAVARIEKTTGSKNSPEKITKKKIRIGEWRKCFKKVLYDQTYSGKKMLNLDNVPRSGEPPTANIISLSGAGDREMTAVYKATQRQRFKVMYKRMEENLDDLLVEAEKSD